jgi:hypothetical protein
MKWYLAGAVGAAVLLAGCTDNSNVTSPSPKSGVNGPSLSASGVSGATYTTNNPAVDGLGTCNNGNPAAVDPTVNCNIYDQKAFVWLTGGPPSGGSALEDGTYFFAVLVPGGQNNDVNDGQNSPDFGGDVGTNKNLSDEHDSYQNRTFVVSGGKVVIYDGDHNKFNAGTNAAPDYMIRLMPYSNTTNLGGEYDMAICKYDPLTYDPASEATAATAAVCKYDNFKIRLTEEPPPVPDALTAHIAITPNGTNAVGTQHVFTIDASVAGGTKPYAITITPDVQPAPGSYSTTCTAGSFSSNNNSFSCTVTINSTAPGVFVANAKIEVTDASDPQKNASDNTATPGRLVDGPVTKYYVAARISLSPPTATNGIGEQHTVTAFLEQNDGSGWSPATGKTATFSLSTVGGTNAAFTPTAGSNTCVTGSVAPNAGKCAVTFNKPDAGVVTVNASSSFVITVGGNSATVTPSTSDAANTTLGGTGAATKTYVDGTLQWSKVDQGGSPLAGATFQAKRTLDRFGNAVSGPTITVTDNSAPDQNPAAGAFRLTGLPLGTWTVKETVAPVPYQLDATTRTTTLGTSTSTSPSSYTFTIAWVNIGFRGCTPGFWQGGAGSKYWNVSNDADWNGSTAAFKPNPFAQGNTFPAKGASFTLASTSPADVSLTITTITGVNLAAGGTRFIDIVGTGGTDDWPRKGARDMIAAYLNASFMGTGLGKSAYTRQTILTEWNAAAAAYNANGSTTLLQAFHLKYDRANNFGCSITR